MVYQRRKQMRNQNRTVSGYKRADGTRVSSYTRRKVAGNQYRTVKRKC